MDGDLRADLDLARHAALEAGRRALRAFRTDLQVRHKSPGQPVTPADLEADAVLQRILLTARPDDGWRSEETADSPDRTAGHRVWIIDPIDGTRSYIAGRPEYAVSVGLAVTHSPRVGVVLNPSTGELFMAARGAGAWLERMPATDAGLAAAAAASLELSTAVPLRVSPREQARGLTLIASRSELRSGEFDALTDWHVVGHGSTTCKLAKVARGEADAFFSRGPKSEWDLCAGALLVEQAGGRVSDLAGCPLRFDQSDPSINGVVATNGVLHEAVLARIATLPPRP